MFSLCLFRRVFFISIVGHIVVFSVFAVSFGNKIPTIDYASVYFLGQFLYNSTVSQPMKLSKTIKPRQEENLKLQLEKITQSPLTQIQLPYYAKPLLALTSNRQKQGWRRKSQAVDFAYKKRQTSIVFHPLLPYSFSLYFKNRQVAHIELAFKIVPGLKRSSIVIKRKISSGNLDADLLSMRYISHYLFIQQRGFTPSVWQTVKIDLSKEEKR